MALEDEVRERLLELCRRLALEGAKWRVVGTADAVTLLYRHVLDALLYGRDLPSRPGLEVVDVGSGAGLPALPLAIAHPSIRVTAVESNGKKARLIESLAKDLGLSNVEVIQARAEDLGHSSDHRERRDVAVARALAPLPIALELLLPLVRRGGLVLNARGPGAALELSDCRELIEWLGGEDLGLRSYVLPGGSTTFHMVRIAKRRGCPGRFPRSASRMARGPARS